MGNATINGVVHGQVVDVLGDVTLGPKAHVDGQVVCTGGRVEQAPGSFVGGQIVEQSIGSGRHHFGAQFGPWIYNCLRWGRPLGFGVHLAWIWLWTLGLLGALRPAGPDLSGRHPPLRGHPGAAAWNHDPLRRPHAARAAAGVHPAPGERHRNSGGLSAAAGGDVGRAGLRQERALRPDRPADDRRVRPAGPRGPAGRLRLPPGLPDSDPRPAGVDHSDGPGLGVRRGGALHVPAPAAGPGGPAASRSRPRPRAFRPPRPRRIPCRSCHSPLPPKRAPRRRIVLPPPRPRAAPAGQRGSAARGLLDPLRGAADRPDPGRGDRGSHAGHVLPRMPCWSCFPPIR